MTGEGSEGGTLVVHALASSEVTAGGSQRRNRPNVKVSTAEVIVSHSYKYSKEERPVIACIVLPVPHPLACMYLLSTLLYSWPRDYTTQW